ncbi:hypothetical protein [Bdellovibrio sp. BCCA]|uniref:hypothetical protein n=1 Tax=Bdellovibrio sp. BCCA TaxID=3136281 RepID=UPI0030F07C3D
MRSRPFVKRTLPCLAVVLAVTMQAVPAHAGLFDKIMSAATQILNNAKTTPSQPLKSGMTGAQAANATQASGTAKAPFNVEADVIGKIVAETQPSPYSTDLRKTSKAVAEKVSLVATETHTEIIPEYTEKGLIFRIRYDETALQNPKLLVKDLALARMLTSTSNYWGTQSSIFEGTMNEKLRAEVESPHAIAELITNVREGSPTAKARWNTLQADLLENVSVKQNILQEMGLSSNVVQDIREELKAKSAALDEAAAQHARKQQKALDKWKSETGALDKMEAMQDKLDDLILKNDRKGVRQMLEAYLPWSVMEPVEANTWKIWLEAIEHPDASKSTVAFRGLKYDTDKIQRKQTANGEVYGFMSTVLTKNQGSYTRRLRSLSTNREKNGDIGFKVHGENIRSTKITDQMTAHARSPVASSFISFTYDPNIAYRFMGQNVTKQVKGENVSVPYGGLLVVKMDSRRMIPNVPSMYSNEIELLAPLLVFPDEVVKYKEGSFTNEYSFANFVKEISDKTGINFTNWSTAADANNEGLRERYNREGHEFLKQMTEVNLKAMSCSKVF